MPTGGGEVYSRVAVVGAVVVLSLFALAGVLFVRGDDSLQRLGLLFGLLGTGLAAFVAMLKADLSATQTNGKLDARIQAAVHRAQDARRRGEAPLTPAEVDAIGPDGPAPASVTPGA